MPKSPILAYPFEIKQFYGLISKCIILLLCIYNNDYNNYIVNSIFYF